MLDALRQAAGDDLDADAIAVAPRAEAGGRVNPGRLDQPLPGEELAVCQHLADAVHDWWDAEPPPIVYRTRTVPAARSMAFTRSCDGAAVEAGWLREATSLLVALVTDHGFDVPEGWL